MVASLRPNDFPKFAAAPAINLTLKAAIDYTYFSGEFRI
jgi:hypothetical protein